MGDGTSHETDMLMRNVNTGAFEVYDIANNTLGSFAAMGAVGLDWQVAGIAADPPSGANAQLAQAMASYASTDGALDASAPLGAATAQLSSATLLAAQIPHTNST